MIPPHPAHPYLATTGERVVAHVIDWLVELGVALVIALPLIATTDFSTFSDPWRRVTWLELWLGGGWLLVSMTHALLLEGRTGQTLGKRVMGIRVVTVGGAPVRWTHALVRWLCHSVDSQFFVLGLVLIATRPLKQRVGDMAAGTIVVRAG